MNEVVSSLWVDKTRLDNCEWHEAALPELDAGQILLETEKYALTANNITYAAVGDGFGYWNFFPTGDEGHGIVPVWGFATVIASNNDSINTGERVYGYFPMASHLVVSPANVTDAAFVDGAEHRQGLALVYNQYYRLGTETGQHEEERALFQPLFTTSFLIEDTMRRADWHGAEAVVMTSASSKTALALASVVKNSSPGIKRIAMTSPTNRDFVESTGLYGQVLTYDELGKAVRDQPVVSVDFAGNGKLLADIHAQWGDNLKFSMLVGATHVEQRSGAEGMQGPTPVMFFAPTAGEELIGEVGQAAFRAAVDEQFSAFLGDVGKHLNTETLVGKDAIRSSYLEMLAGDVSPSRGLICKFG